MKEITISLTRNDWNCVDKWVQCVDVDGHTKAKTELKAILFDIIRSINYHPTIRYGENEVIPFIIPRDLLHLFVVSIGQIGYSFTVKTLLAKVARQILMRVETQISEQLPLGDRWYTYGY